MRALLFSQEEFEGLDTTVYQHVGLCAIPYIVDVEITVSSTLTDELTFALKEVERYFDFFGKKRDVLLGVLSQKRQSAAT